MNYPIVIVELSMEDGGGFCAYVPDLPGCMSDGETAAEALVGVNLAIGEWVDAARRLDRLIPKPRSVFQNETPVKSKPEVSPMKLGRNAADQTPIEQLYIQAA